jgi:molecular chaperone DnaK
MRTLLPVITLSVLAFGCQTQSREPLVIGDSTPMVGANRTTTEALGIETSGGMFRPLIKPGTPVPCSFTQVFSTDADGQSQITIAPLRGTSRMAASNHALGQFQIVGIPSAPSGTPMIDVTFSVTERQILLSARDLTRQADLEIRRVGGGAGHPGH